MIKRLNKKIIALMLSAVMVFGMTGCGKEKKDDSSGKKYNGRF